MTALPLPEKSVRLSPNGFSKLYAIAQSSPDAAKALADQIHADPRGVLERLFKLTKIQKQAIDNTSDAVLRERAEALLVELRSEAPHVLRFYPQAPEGAVRGGGGRGPRTMGCTCLFLRIV